MRLQVVLRISEHGVFGMAQLSRVFLGVIHVGLNACASSPRKVVP